MFVDEINLTVFSGAGGSGSVSFNNISTKSSPNGGSGGVGGSVKISVSPDLHDLSHIISNSPGVSILLQLGWMRISSLAL